LGGIGTASAKLILFGEHAAVYGHPAVGMALPESTTTNLFGKSADAWNVENIPREDRATVLEVLDRIERLLPIEPQRVRCSVQVSSNVPRGLGFGSSAALCGAFARALVGRDGNSAWELAHAAERLFHGTPSGVDTGLSLMEGMCAVFPQPGGLPRAERLPPAPLWLVVAAVARNGACGALVARLAARMNEGDPAALAAVNALGAIARAALQALREPVGADLASRVARLADDAMEHLRGVGLANPAQDRLLATGKRAGALGGKLSGAGAGGAFFLITADEESARSVARSVDAEAREQGIPLGAPVKVISAAGAHVT